MKDWNSIDEVLLEDLENLEIQITLVSQSGVEKDTEHAGQVENMLIKQILLIILIFLLLLYTT